MFKKYPSITNAYKAKTINEILFHFPNELWHITEKIHGANMSISIDDEITYGKRSGPIKITENFYSYDKIERYLQKIGDIFRKELGNCLIYGELAGGHYPHPEIKSENHSMVQKGVYYSPRNEFIIFDVFLNNEFLDYREVVKICENNDLYHCKILFEGSFGDCLQYPNEFQTTIPEYFGLPNIEKNICEGVVIKPYKSLFFNSGERVILKNKNSKFSEKQKDGTVSLDKINNKLTPEQTIQLQELCELLNENRLNNIISKIGQVTNKDFGKVNGLLIQDMLQEYGKVDRTITKKLQYITADFMREKFISVVNE